MEWKFENGRPIYLQIVDELTSGIASGIFAPGERLPSVRDLAVEAGVNPNTIQRALAEMERKQLVYSERTNGRFVTKEVGVLKQLHEEMAENIIREMLERLKKIGISDEEMMEMIKRGMEQWH